MKRQLFIIFFITVNLAFIKAQENTYLGEINGLAGKDSMVYLRTWYSNASLDSSLCDSEGKFRFTVKTKSYDKGYSIGKKNEKGKVVYAAYFILGENDHVFIDFSAKDKVVFMEGKGLCHKAFFNGIDYIGQEIKKNPNLDSLCTSCLFNCVDSIFKIDPFSALELTIMNEDIMFFYHSSAKKHLPAYYANLSKIETEYANNPRFIQLSSRVQIGKAMPILEVYNEADEKINIKNDSGFLLIDFWASWCVPCLIKLNKLNELVAKQKMQHIKIIDVSIDESKEKWLYALEKHKFKWQHAWIGENKKNNKIIQNCQIYSIPTSFLVDKNGIILSINPTEEEIMELKKR